MCMRMNTGKSLVGFQRNAKTTCSGAHMRGSWLGTETWDSTLAVHSFRLKAAQASV